MNNDNDYLVEKKMEDIAAIIENTKSNKIIIAGDRKGGKTEVLKYYASKYNDNNKVVLYLDYKDFLYVSALNEKMYNSYYEVILVKMMLDSLKNINSKLCSDFAMFEHYVKMLLDRFRGYLITRIEPNNDITFEKGSLIEKMNVVFKISGINSVNVLIDHFDGVGECSERFQTLMKDFFKYFDRMIVTTDEKMSDDKVERLKNDNYSIVNVCNGRNIAVVRKVINVHLSEWNERIMCNYDWFIRLQNVNKMLADDLFVKDLISKCDGNLDIMMHSVRYYITGEDLEHAIESEISMNNSLDCIVKKRILHL